MKANQKVISSVAGASILLAVMGIISKGIGFVREIIYANNFGLSREFDIYLAGAALPIVINTAVIYLCQHYFIPAYNKIKKESEKESTAFFNFNFWWFIFGGIVLAFLLVLCSEIIINFYLSSVTPELKERGLRIFLLFLLTIPFNAGISVITAYLQANFNFLMPALAQILLNIVVIILIFFFTDLFNILVIPLSFITAYIISFFFLLSLSGGKIKFLNRDILKFRYRFSDFNTIILLIFIEGFSLSYILIDRYFIGKIPEGGIAALNYAIVIFALPVGLFSLPMITAIFPRFSESAINFRENLRDDFKLAVEVNIFIFVPISMMIYFWGDLFLHLFYERGAFSQADTVLTNKVLQLYTVSLIFYSAYLIVVKLLYSINEYKLILIISFAAFCLKILFNVLLADSMLQDGLALSTSFVYIFLFLSGFYLGIKKTGLTEKSFHFKNIIYFLLNGSLSYIIVYLLFDLSTSDSVHLSILSLIVFILIYSINSILLNDNESELILNAISNFNFIKRI